MLGLLCEGERAALGGDRRVGVAERVISCQSSALEPDGLDEAASGSGVRDRTTDAGDPKGVPT